MGKKLVLAALVQAKKDHVEAFKEWYLGNHIEDAYNCPIVSTARCFRAAHPFNETEPPSGYLTLYEFIGEDAVAAEKSFSEYLANPDAYADRLPSNGSLEVLGVGWYQEELTFGPKIDPA